MKEARVKACRVGPLAALVLLGCLSLGGLLSGCRGEMASAPAPAGPRPNVLLMVVDDLNTALGAYGNARVSTPSVDRLAARGVVFERAYCQYPLCNPSRTSFLAGRRPQTLGVLSMRTPPARALAENVSLPTHFRQHGYWTMRAGKILHGVAFEGAIEWDVVGKLNRPLAKLKLGEASQAGAKREPSARDEPNARASARAGEEGRAAPQRHEDPAADDGEGENRLLSPIVVEGAEARLNLRDHHVAEEAVRWLKRSQRREEPFFMALGFHRPHLPFEAPEKFFALYPPESIELPIAPPPGAPPVPPRAVHTRASFPSMTPDEQRRVIASYYASVSYVDSQVGLVLEALDKLGLAESTVVVLTSDHGFLLGEHGGLWGKGALYEPAVRVPLMVTGPGIAAGARCPRPVELLDLYPTLSELAGLPLPEGLEGKSLLPLLRQPAAAWERPAYTVLSIGDGEDELARTVRTERFRYTEWGSRERAELYDHQADPDELYNLADDPAAAGQRHEMEKLLRKGEARGWKKWWPWG